MVTQNTKAHFDPFCIGSSLGVIVVGSILIYFAMYSSMVSTRIIAIFGLMVLFSHLVHFFMHGLEILSGISMIISITVVILIFRMLIGTSPGFSKYFYGNIIYWTGLLIGLDFIKTIK